MQRKETGPVGTHKRADFTTKSRLERLITQQDSKVRGDTQMLVKEIVALFRKLADQEASGPGSQRLSTKRGDGVAGCGQLLGARILCSCGCLCRSGHNGSVNIQKDKGYSLLCNFFSLCEWKSVSYLHRSEP